MKGLFSPLNREWRIGPDDVPFARLFFEYRSYARSLCCAVATGLAGSQYSVVAGQWRAATVNAYPCRVVGCFAFLGVNGNLPYVPVVVHGPYETHTRVAGTHASPRLAQSQLPTALDRPPASPSQLLPDNLTTRGFPASLFSPAFVQTTKVFARADIFRLAAV